jgi:hypothetical protein
MRVLLLAGLLASAQSQLMLHELQDHLFAQGHGVSEHCLQFHAQGNLLAGEVYHQAVSPVTPVFDLPYHEGFHSLATFVYHSRAPPAQHTSA